jgi:peptidoglycan/xylan/chitin deacetylase (PgdA/CDA1 family)
VIRERIARWRFGPPGALILLYHRVTHLTPDRWSIAVTPEHFADHMEQVRRRTRAVPLTGLAAALAAPNAARPVVVVTFDDGYADNLHEALPVLKQHDVPVTLFVSTRAITTGREFWWDELARMLGPGGRYDAMWTKLRDADAATRESELETIRTATGTDEVTPRADHRPLSVDELARLAGEPLVELGAHTVSHPRLAALHAASQRDEIEESRRVLESLTGRRVESFAYPFGRAADYTPETMALVRDAGFTRACINQAGRVTPSTDPFALPRLYVRDWTGDELAAQLRRHGIRV